MIAIEVKDLIKNYDDIEAVKKISFTVEKDSFFAFLGPNGAGKSTTINIISTLLDKNSGDVIVLDNVIGIGNIDTGIDRSLTTPPAINPNIAAAINSPGPLRAVGPGSYRVALGGIYAIDIIITKHPPHPGPSGAL